MLFAWLLTIVAWAGIVIGALAGEIGTFSSPVGAAGAGLLSGIAIFWVIPDIAGTVGWTPALLLALAACFAMLGLDRVLAHSHHTPVRRVIGPLLAAAAVHSFLDGWSVRLFPGDSLAHVAVPVGLALHKLPEGLALGWISRKSFSSSAKAIAAGAAAEFATLVGALLEPHANRSGFVEFGIWWTSLVLAVIAGSFLFIGCHALLPDWKRPRVLLPFLATLAAVGILRR